MRLDYQLTGPEDAPFLLLGSSLGTTHEMWAPQLEPLSERFRVVAFDRPGLVINLGLNLILIPRFGYIGASWATVATEIGLVLAGWLALRGVQHAVVSLRLLHQLVNGAGNERAR